MRRRKATMNDLENFKMFQRIDEESAKKAKAALESGELELEESSFNDPGPDYTALYVGQRQLAFWPGY